MSVFAAVMTGKGTGAIATIQFFGDSAKCVIEKIFKPPIDLNTGKIHVGTITDGNQAIDQVTIGCESHNTFTINCHGNPLIVEQIMQLLQKHKVKLITAEQMIAKTFKGNDTIALEAKLVLPKAKTIEGTKIILNQIDSGLTAAIKNWQKADIKQIVDEAKEILQASQIAKLIIYGCKIVLAGPPNSGKSTLFNRLIGKEKAIVTNIKGTTRDWISAECRIKPLAIELIDTAGLDERLADDIDKSAQQAALDIINIADLILIVLDNHESDQNLSSELMKKVKDKKTLTVFNKSDLINRRAGLAPPTQNGGVNPTLQDIINISALTDKGIDSLTEKILEITGIKYFDTNQPIYFTARQEQLLNKLSKTKSKESANSIISELLSGKVNV